MFDFSGTFFDVEDDEGGRDEWERNGEGVGYEETLEGRFFLEFALGKGEGIDGDWEVEVGFVHGFTQDGLWLSFEIILDYFRCFRKKYNWKITWFISFW